MIYSTDILNILCVVNENMTSLAAQEIRVLLINNLLLILSFKYVYIVLTKVQHRKTKSK